MNKYMERAVEPNLKWCQSSLHLSYMNLKIACLLTLIFFCSCTQNTPKPVAYPHIKKVTNDYVPYNYYDVRFFLSDAAIVNLKPSQDNNTIAWFDISYPDYKATIYCSYLSITKNNLREALDDSYHLAYGHATKANGINQTIYTNEEHHTAGTIYDIKGQVATPIQFFVTDSISRFFRGSLYYNQKMNPDSIAPATEYIKEDIIKLIESIEWKHD